MFQIEISADKREVSGKGPMRQLRMQGLTPGVVYGGGQEAQMLQLNTKELYAKLLQCARKNSVVTLNIDGLASKSVEIGEIQTDPVRDSLIHVDFCEINLDKEKVYSVPVKYTGTSKGVALGGDLNVFRSTLKVSGKPLDIPDNIEVSITNLGMGSNIKCGEIEMPANVTLVTDGKAVAVSVEKPA